jgi:hypothetical protein
MFLGQVLELAILADDLTMVDELDALRELY